ncbi:hypothetical protein [Halomicronema hongdechloris]|nr:hypothetical protein [Halomicronema hongdechloris]
MTLYRLFSPREEQRLHISHPLRRTSCGPLSVTESRLALMAG